VFESVAPFPVSWVAELALKERIQALGIDLPGQAGNSGSGLESPLIAGISALCRSGLDRDQDNDCVVQLVCFGVAGYISQRVS
jgi:hypothetical protein